MAAPPPSRVFFPSPFAFSSCKPLTLIELRMRTYSGKIRQKPRWWEKVQDVHVVAKWRAEMVEHDCLLVEKLWSGDKRYNHGRGMNKWPQDPISEAQLDYVFDELRYEASRVDPETGVFASVVPMVHESQSLISPSLQAALVFEVAKLEDVSEEEKDWHPGSNRQVLDLVHPSLCYLRIGHSQIVEDESVRTLTAEEYMTLRPDLTIDDTEDALAEDRESCAGPGIPMSLLSDPAKHQALMEEKTESPTLSWRFRLSPKYKYTFLRDRYDASWALSEKRQWLPTDFAVLDDGSVSPLGYINNLHPIEHRSIYPVICAVLQPFVPVFERVVCDALSPPRPYAVNLRCFQWYEGIPSPGRGASGEEWEEHQRLHQWPVIPDLAPFTPPTDDGRVTFSLQGRTLQVIVKLANIVLTPDNPTYTGCSWHVEGMLNERIVATGIYYYACENITESRLAFRRTASPPDGHDMIGSYDKQTDNRGVTAAWGFGRGQPLSQGLGNVVAHEGKCIAFPNVYQHRVQPFELADPSRPGHRKILCFFLVDPTVRVLSTTDVLPQQKSWNLSEIACAAFPRFGDLPQEIRDMIMGHVHEHCIDRDEAERQREELMGERSQCVADQDDNVYQVGLNMCEH